MLTSTFDVCALLYRTDAYHYLGVYTFAKVELLSVVVLAVHVVPAGRRITAPCAATFALRVSRFCLYVTDLPSLTPR